MMQVLICVLASAVYATLRYNVFKGVPWSWWPVYVVNKALALGALAALVWMLLRTAADRRNRADMSSWILACMGMHVMISLAIMNSTYYPKYYVSAAAAKPAFTLLAGFSWLGGAIAGGWMFLRLRRCEAGTAETDLPMGLIALLVGTHAALLGVKGWFEPWTWPGYMPPITLLSFLLGVSAAVIAAAHRRR